MKQKVCSQETLGLQCIAERGLRGLILHLLSLVALCFACGIYADSPAADSDHRDDFDPCIDLEDNDPMLHLIAALIHPENRHPRAVYSRHGSYQPGEGRYIAADGSWSVLQPLPGWRKRDALFIYRSNGSITPSNPIPSVNELMALRFDEKYAHRLLVGLNRSGTQFDVAELTFDGCISAETVEITWLSVGLSRDNALELLRAPDKLYTYEDVQLEPPSPFDVILSNPLDFRVRMVYLSKSIVLLWTNPVRYLERLEPAGG